MAPYSTLKCVIINLKSTVDHLPCHVLLQSSFTLSSMPVVVHLLGVSSTHFNVT
jgi:hypothetical protein